VFTFGFDNFGFASGDYYSEGFCVRLIIGAKGSQSGLILSVAFLLYRSVFHQILKLSSDK